MSDELSPKNARDLACNILGLPVRETTDDDVIEALAATAPDADDAPGLPPERDEAEVEAEDLRSGCPDSDPPGPFKWSTRESPGGWVVP